MEYILMSWELIHLLSKWMIKVSFWLKKEISIGFSTEMEKHAKLSSDSYNHAIFELMFNIIEYDYLKDYILDELN